MQAVRLSLRHVTDSILVGILMAFDQLLKSPISAAQTKLTYISLVTLVS